MAYAMRLLNVFRAPRGFWNISTGLRPTVAARLGSAQVQDDLRVSSVAKPRQHSSLCQLCALRSDLFESRTGSQKEHFRGSRTNFLALSLGLGAASFISYGVYRWLRNNDITSISLFPQVHAVSIPVGSLRSKFNFIADVVQEAAPASVYIEIKGRHPFSRQPITLSRGSGFLVRSDGVILTNAHVVSNRSEVSVTLHDGRTFSGQVTAVDQTSDLACIKINGNNLPFLRLGDSNTLRPGEWVIAVGSPLSLSNTVTAGIVSSVHRGSKELGIHNNMEYIQTDAQITFGNSGGALINLDGEAIGINSMKITAGISFAIPSDYAKSFLEVAEKHMAKSGSTSRRFVSSSGARQHFIGITMVTLNSQILGELRERMPGFPDGVTHGVFVYQVTPESPAQMAGVRAGDVIESINGKEIRASADVYSTLESGKALEVRARRGESSIEFKIIPETLD